MNSATNLKIGIAQVNLIVGDIDFNVRRIVEMSNQAMSSGCEVVVFPELTVCGYPPEDLLLRADFVAACGRGMQQAVASIPDIHAIFGWPEETEGTLYNAAIVACNGREQGRYRKSCLPNYGVFDEKRYFSSASESLVVTVNGVPLAVLICEDVWESWPSEMAVKAGAKGLICLNASPYHLTKDEERLRVVATQASAAGIPILYANLLGGQDELVFDGASFAVDCSGKRVLQCPAFSEGLEIVHFNSERGYSGNFAAPETVSLEENVYAALVLGVRDYVDKNGFAGVVLGLSGGIDSALTLAVAVDAIGPERVEAVSMPSRYTQQMSIDDARDEAERFGVAFSILPIEPMFESFLGQLQGAFAGLPVDATEENIQARCRGTLLMAISNKKRKIVLTTGNKSEMAVGYATLYGDMAGGFAAIKDVPKTLVYRLAEYRNRQSMVIPQRVIDRPPSAELAPDQKDEDNLPPYEVLDPILEAYIEDHQSLETIVGRGFEAETVRRVIELVDRNEYKRRQAPPGVKITRRAFGRDRRYPLTNGYKRIITE